VTSKEELEKIKALMAEWGDQQNKITDSMASYLSHVKKLGALQSQINFLTKTEVDLRATLTKISDEQLDLDAKITALKVKRKTLGGVLSKADEAELSAIKDKLKNSRKLEEVTNKTLADTQLQTTQLKAQSAILSESVKKANKLTIAYNEVGSHWNKMPQYAKQFYGYISSLQALNMSRDIKTAALSMGVMSNQSKFFMQSMSNASKSTLQIGVGVSDLAKGQQAYSDAIGRSIMLTEDNYQAMAEMSRGTLLGMDGAAGMAADMERFGLSASSARDAVQGTVKSAHMMGANANKSVKNLTGTLRIAQKFNFRGGTKNMGEMAAYAAKMRIEMDSLTGMAEKVFRPEGAVEMAARLQTMGGAMARIGDPFQLMFKARNDFGGFVKDIGNAASEFAFLNEKTGEFDISALGMDRLREISTITGVAVEELSNLGRKSAQFKHIETLIPNMFDPEDKELISSLATFDGKSKQWQIKIGQDAKDVRQLGEQELKRYKEQQVTLKKNAEVAQTFDDAFTNLINQFKTMALPFVEALNDSLVNPLIQFQKKLDQEGVIDNLKAFMGQVGKVVGTVGGLILEFPKISAGVALGGTIFFNLGKWWANGVALRKGFNALGGGGLPMGGGGSTTAWGGKGGKIPKGFKFDGKGGGGLSAMGKIGKGMKGNALLAGAMGIGNVASDLYQGKDFTESLVRGLLTTGGGLLGGIGGSLVAPGVGTMAGGIAGGMIGDYAADKIFNVDDAVVKFNPQDKFATMKDGIVASTSKGKIDDLVGSGSKSAQKITFGDININGSIKLELSGSGSNTPSRDIEMKLNKDPHFIREITKLIQEQLRSNLAGGKLSPNPLRN